MVMRDIIIFFLQMVYRKEGFPTKNFAIMENFCRFKSRQILIVMTDKY